VWWETAFLTFYTAFFIIMNTPENLYGQIRDLLLRAKQHSVYQINTLMVRTYFEIGRFIVEHEQQGKERAAYGKQTLDELAQKLSAEFGKGFSTVNLRQMRLFYTTYQIQQTASAELQTPDFQLSWSHYLKLMRMEDTIHATRRQRADFCEPLPHYSAR
jgi:hypothetical protein